LNHYKKDTEYCFKVLDVWVNENIFFLPDYVVPVYWEEIDCHKQWFYGVTPI
jgi:hypothetical protein